MGCFQRRGEEGRAGKDAREVRLSSTEGLRLICFRSLAYVSLFLFTLSVVAVGSCLFTPIHVFVDGKYINSA